jgi:hypothetical protein
MDSIARVSAYSLGRPKAHKSDGIVVVEKCSFSFFALVLPIIPMMGRPVLTVA